MGAKTTTGFRASVAVACCVAIGLPVGARAATSLRPNFTNVRQQINAACLSAIFSSNDRLAAAGRPRLSLQSCSETVTTTVGDPQAVTAAQVASRANAPAALLAAVNAGTVHSRSFKQTISQITDQETQSGYFYYDGSRVWVTSSYRGYRGWHSCIVNYAVGYSIDVQSCSDSGIASSNTLHMGLTVRLLGGWIPVSWHEDHDTHLSATGAISY